LAHPLAQLLTALPNLSIPAGGTDSPPQALAYIHLPLLPTLSNPVSNLPFLFGATG